MILSKSDFLGFRQCDRDFWLRRRRPEAVAWPAPSAMERMTLRDGQEAEKASRPFLEHHFDAAELGAQVTFETDRLLARADFVRQADDGSIEIIEVKATTSLKRGAGNDHVVDVAFQAIVARRAGATVAKCHIVHLNGEYVRQDELDPIQLFTIVDVTAEAEVIATEVEAQIEGALGLLDRADIDLDGCECRYLGNIDNRCAAFDYLNQDIPDPSAHHLPRITSAKLKRFDEEGRFELSKILPDELTELQKCVHAALSNGMPVIDVDGIRGFLGGLSFPLHFYDYETCAPPIPAAVGHRPYRQLPVQFSLHKLHADGRLEHFEWVADDHGQQDELVQELAKCVEPAGSMVVWNASFEKGCNSRLAELRPEHTDSLADLNNRTVDLMEPFKRHYVDPGFRGSTSIKVVMPVLCPDLAYPEDDVHDGTGAIEAWLEMISTHDAERRANLRRQLLAYCKLDTLAMVRIYECLVRIAADNDATLPI